MRKAFCLLIVSLSLILLDSCKSCNTYIPVDPKIMSLIFKPGSYFIYSDSADHITDSQYVYQYAYYKEGVNYYYEDGCYSYYATVSASHSSFRNGVFFDNIDLQVKFDPYDLIISDSLGTYYSARVFSAYLDTITLNNYNINGHIYPKVYKGNPLTILESGISIPTDIYFAPNYGIVRRVEHRSTGDVNWDLIRYHLVN